MSDRKVTIKFKSKWRILNITSDYQGWVREEGRGMAIAGLVLGIVTLVCWLLAIIFLWAFIAALFGFGGFYIV